MNKIILKRIDKKYKFKSIALYLFIFNIILTFVFYFKGKMTLVVFLSFLSYLFLRKHLSVLKSLAKQININEYKVKVTYFNNTIEEFFLLGITKNIFNEYKFKVSTTSENKAIIFIKANEWSPTLETNNFNEKLFTDDKIKVTENKNDFNSDISTITSLMDVVLLITDFFILNKSKKVKERIIK